MTKQLVLKALSRVFSYPNVELQSHWEEITEVLHPLVKDSSKLWFFSTLDIADWQALYTETFDLNRTNSLHLYEHIYGQSRERGKAMVDLAQFYEDHGFYLSSNELPDYLPLILEFLAQQKDKRIDALTPEIINVVVLLKERLKNTPYGVFMFLLKNICVGSIDDKFVKISLKRRPSQTIDDLWEEPAAFGNNVSMMENHD